MSLSANSITHAYHEILNPVLWKDGKLDPEIKDKLLTIAAAFLDFIEIEVDVHDITLTGSLANFNYTKHSDFDLHILTDFTDYNASSDLLKDYFNAKKTIWNITRNISVKGYEVEVYIQGIYDPHHSTGVYSLKTDKWLVKPKRVESASQVDVAQVLKKKQTLLQMINFALGPECDVECAEKAKEKILNVRKVGLEKEGEFSPENLAYKELRRSGDIERLIKGVLAKKDALLSLKQENFKTYMSVGGLEKRGPRHQGLTAGVNRATSPNVKTVGMVARSHTNVETPFPKIERLKAKKNGIETLTPQEAQSIATFYELDLEKVKTEPRGLSTSGIKIGFNTVSGVYVLTK